jgi:hypothetical protein
MFPKTFVKEENAIRRKKSIRRFAVVVNQFISRNFASRISFNRLALK